MIKCLECNYLGNPLPVSSENSVEGCVEICPDCKGVNYDVILDNQQRLSPPKTDPETIATSFMEIAKLNSNNGK
jgi:hypothetical protein